MYKAGTTTSQMNWAAKDKLCLQIFVYNK